MEKNTKIDINTLRPFGPIILHGRVPMYVVDNYNKYCDEIISNEEKLKKQDHSQNLAGNVRNEFYIGDEFIKKEKNLLNIVNLMAQRMIIGDQRGEEDEVAVSFLKNAPPTTMKILPSAIVGCDLVTLWCVSQWAGDFNPLHVHSCDLSGVLYLKVPEGLEEEYKREDHHAGVGDIQFIAGTPQSFSRNNLKVRPSVGDFYVFPAWLHHTAYPFRTKNQERRSLSFNLVYKIDENKI